MAEVPYNWWMPTNPGQPLPPYNPNARTPDPLSPWERWGARPSPLAPPQSFEVDPDAYLRALPRPDDSSNFGMPGPQPPARTAATAVPGSYPLGATIPSPGYPAPPEREGYTGAMSLDLKPYLEGIPPGGIKMPNIQAPNVPVPQRDAPAQYDFGPARERFERARPKPTTFDPKDRREAMLLGAIEGLAGGRQRDIGRNMAAGAAKGALNERAYQRAVGREDARESRLYEERGSAFDLHTQGLQIARQDTADAVKMQNAGAVYEDAWKKSLWAKEMAMLSNDIASKNFSMAMQRLQTAHQFAAGDRAFELQVTALNDQIARGDWETTFRMAQQQFQENAVNAQLGMNYWTRTISAGRGSMAGLDDNAFLSKLVPEVASGQAVIPGLDVNTLQDQAAAAYMQGMAGRGMVGSNQSFQDRWVKLQVMKLISDKLRELMQTNPNAFDQFRQSYGRLPVPGASPAPQPSYEWQ